MESFKRNVPLKAIIGQFQSVIRKCRLYFCWCINEKMSIFLFDTISCFFGNDLNLKFILWIEETTFPNHYLDIVQDVKATFQKSEAVQPNLVL